MVKLNVTDKLIVKTKTFNNAFGTCQYEILKLKQKCPICNKKDGIVVKLLGGLEASSNARAGTELTDCEKNIQKNIADKLCSVVGRVGIPEEGMPKQETKKNTHIVPKLSQERQPGKSDNASGYRPSRLGYIEM